MAWADVRYREQRVTHPAIDAWLSALGRVYEHGGGLLRVFEPRDTGVFDHAVQHAHHDPTDPLLAFLSSPEVVAACPELRIETPLKGAPVFQEVSLYAMEGELTYLLLVGGAYTAFQGTVDEARVLSRRFMEALCGPELHLGRLAWASKTPWTPWFFDLAWDHTFLICDHGSRRVILLCVTDTD
jgi:hypothetical protein